MDRSKRVSQVIVGASPHDAVTNMALSVHSSLERQVVSSIYSFHLPDKSVSDRIRPCSEFGVGTEEDVLIYHVTYGDPVLTELILSRPERLVLVYHNVTPAGFFVEQRPHFALGLWWSRYELLLLKERVERVIADSHYNAEDLAELGFSHITVVPAGVNPRRLDDTPLDVELLRELEEQFPNGFALFVSQVLPHKRLDLALEAVHLVRTTYGSDIGLVVAGKMRDPLYAKSIESFTASLPHNNVRFLGEISDSALATLYRCCLCYVNPSDHEGLAVPPLEAMAMGAPVIVRDRGAMKETVSYGGIVLDRDSGAVDLCEAIRYVSEEDDAQAELRRRGYLRSQDFDRDLATSRFLEVISDLLE